SALGLKDEEERAVRSFQFLTLKPELILVNCDESGIGRALPPEFLHSAPVAMACPAKLELELQDFSEEERQSFMRELGLKGLLAPDSLRGIYSAMNQIVF